MLVLIVATLLGQTAAPPSTVVVTSKRTGVPVERSDKLAADLSTQLSELGVALREPPAESAKRLSEAGFKDGADCGGNRECVAKLGIVLQRRAVIGFQVGEVGDEVAIHLELVDSKTAAKLAQATFVLPVSAPTTEWNKPLKPFAVQVRAALASFPADAPLLDGKPKVEPSETVPGIGAPVERKSRVPSYALAGGALGLAGLGAVSFAIGSSQRASLYGPRRDDGTYSPATTRTEAMQRAQTYDRNFAIAAGAGLVSVALGVGAYLLWPSSP